MTTISKTAFSRLAAEQAERAADDLAESADNLRRQAAQLYNDAAIEYARAGDHNSEQRATRRATALAVPPGSWNLAACLNIPEQR